MHGVSRQKGPSSEEQSKKTKLKIAKYIEVTEALTRSRASHDYSVESLKVSAEVLKINSEYYTAWSFRRHILEHLDSVTEESSESAVEPDQKKPVPPLYADELSFCEQLLASHPKSYWLWLHRTWLLTRLDEIHKIPLWEKELELCSRFLDADRRNFHGWNHRRWVADRCGSSLQAELAYTTKKIEQDFSNYSAWQHRARLYQELVQSGLLDEPTRLKGLDDEFELVRQAFFTEPDDQSPWFYYRWLLNQVPEGREDIFQRELEVCEELLSEEPDSKWALLTTIHLMVRLPSNPEYQALSTVRYSKLIQVDPDRANFYLYHQNKKSF